MNWRAKLDEMVGSCVALVFERYAHDLYTPLYLFYLPANTDTGEWGQLIVENAQSDPDWEYADREKIPSNLTRDQLRWWIRERCNSLPIIGEHE